MKSIRNKTNDKRGVIEDINIFFSCDDNYIPCLSVALKSLEDNADKNRDFNIIILHSGEISQKNIDMILKNYSFGNFKIEFNDITESVSEYFDKLHTRDYYSKITYYRIFIPELYPYLNKALYLDSDIVVKKDISLLYDIPLNDNLVGGVSDGVIQKFKVFQDYVENRLTIDSYSEYFNAGVLLMNLDKMRTSEIQQKFLRLVSAVRFNVAQDQDYLNVLCKNRAVILNGIWNVMPFETTLDLNEVGIFHYNLNLKPWSRAGVLYEEYFWKYAKNTPYFEVLKDKLVNTSVKECEKGEEETRNLMAIARLQADDEKENFAIAKKIEEICGLSVRDKERIKIMKKILSYEEQGLFDKDVEEDPPTIELLPDKVDYLHEKFSTKVKSKIAYFCAEIFLKDILQSKKLIIDRIVGIENLAGLKTGAIITCNHFNAFDSFAVQQTLKKAGFKNGQLYRVIREGNFTNFGGFYGFLMRNCNTLPLSSNRATMVNFVNAVDSVLKDGKFVLFYPEQSMWWNYRKPKPLKAGAYRFAVRNDVPVLPCFIAMQDSDLIGDDGFPIQKYSIFVSKPIYPTENGNFKEKAERLKDENYQIWKNIYEDYYKIPLVYNTKPQTFSDSDNLNDCRNGDLIKAVQTR